MHVPICPHLTWPDLTQSDLLQRLVKALSRGARVFISPPPDSHWAFLRLHFILFAIFTLDFSHELEDDRHLRPDARTIPSDTPGNPESWTVFLTCIKFTNVGGCYAHVQLLVPFRALLWQVESPCPFTHQVIRLASNTTFNRFPLSKLSKQHQLDSTHIVRTGHPVTRPFPCGTLSFPKFLSQISVFF